MTDRSKDLIAKLAELKSRGTLDDALSHRVESRHGAQETYELLLHPADPGPMSLVERRAVALFVTALHRDDKITEHYEELLTACDATARKLSHAIRWEAEKAAAIGPWGKYPPGPLSSENLTGPEYVVGEDSHALLGDRLSAALKHAHLLVFHPRDASDVNLDSLVAAGWTRPGIFTLSQLVSFLSFQVRVISGLRAVQGARHGVAIPA